MKFVIWIEAFALALVLYPSYGNYIFNEDLLGIWGFLVTAAATNSVLSLLGFMASSVLEALGGRSKKIRAARLNTRLEKRPFSTWVAGQNR